MVTGATHHQVPVSVHLDVPHAVGCRRRPARRGLVGGGSAPAADKLVWRRHPRGIDGTHANAATAVIVRTTDARIRATPAGHATTATTAAAAAAATAAATAMGRPRRVLEHGSAVRHVCGEASLRQQHDHAGVVDHVADALAGVGRVDGYVGGASLGHRQGSHHVIRGPLHEDANKVALRDPPPVQVPRQRVGALVELRVGERGAVTHDGRGVRVGRHALFEQRVGAHACAEVLAGLVPIHQHQAALRWAHHAQLTDGCGRRGHSSLQQRRQMLPHAGHGVRLEQRDVVLEGGAERGGSLRHHPLQVEGRHRLVHDEVTHAKGPDLEPT